MEEGRRGGVEGAGGVNPTAMLRQNRGFPSFFLLPGNGVIWQDNDYDYRRRRYRFRLSEFTTMADGFFFPGNRLFPRCANCANAVVK